MIILDYIYLIALGAGILLGFWKGFIKQIFALAGVLIITVGTTYISPLPAHWLEGVITSDTTRNIVAMALTFVVLAIGYGIVTRLISRLVNKTPGLGKVNRILGAVFAVAVVYLSFGFVTALVVETSQEFLPSVKKIFEESWIVNVVYGGTASPGRNFFGHWLFRVLVEKISSLAPDVALAM